MALGADRYASRGDTFAFLGCVLLSVAAMSLPERIRDPLARGLRQTVLAPFLTLQQQTELLSASLARYDAVVAQRDSAALAATFLPELRGENTRLRSLLGLGTRLSSGYVPAEVLHEPEPSSPLTFIVSAGKNQGVKPLSAVVSPEGLVGIVSSVDAKTSVVVSWAHPEFRASAMAADGSVYGIVAPHGSEGPRIWLLELQGVAYRQLVPTGTMILTSGLGGVLPRAVRIERRDAVRRSDKYRFYVILAALVVLQFSVRGRLGGDRVAPDFLLLALLIYTIRARPGPSAAAGFLVGLLRDALTPASFGAGALAHTLVGYLSSWSKAVFFAENLFVNGCLFFAGTWCRNLAVALASGKLKGGLLGWELLVWSPIQSLTTAVAGVLVLWLFGRHLAIRLSDA